MPLQTIAIIAIVALAQPAQPPTARQREEVLKRIADLYEAKRYADALQPARELAAARKQDGQMAYGLAGLLARSGKPDEALIELDRAIKLHAALPEALAVDDDFAGMREDDAFKQRMSAAMLDHEAAQKKAGLSWSVVVPHARPARKKTEPTAPADEASTTRRKKGGMVKVPTEAEAADAQLEMDDSGPVKPISKWRPSPLIVAMHGHGGRKEDMLRLWTAVAAEHGAVLIAPEGPLQGPNDGRSWGVGGRDTPARWITDVVNDTKRRLRVDGSRIVLTGFSQGGGMTYGIGMLYPKTFHGLIPMGGPFTWAEDPIFKTDKLKGQRVFIYCGGDDPNLGMNKQASVKFESAGCAVMLTSAAGVGHALPKDAKALLREALKFVWAK